MSDVLMQKLLKNKVVLIDEEVYRLIGDYSEVQTKLDYEFQHSTNEQDTVMVSQATVKRKIHWGMWKVVELPNK